MNMNSIPETPINNNNNQESLLSYSQNISSMLSSPKDKQKVITVTTGDDLQNINTPEMQSREQSPLKKKKVQSMYDGRSLLAKVAEKSKEKQGQA